MIKLFFDIETVPSEDEQRDAHLAILRKKHAEKTDEEIHRYTSLEGTFGRICCIGVIKEGPQGIMHEAVYAGPEDDILTHFWEVARGVNRFVGHNIWAFDLPFIYKRSLIQGVMPIKLNLARYRDMPVFDTMLQWELWNMGQGRWQSLDTLAKVFGLESSKDLMDGSMVWEYYKEGRFEDIKRYCMKDVELTRQVYYKMAYDDPYNPNVSSDPQDANEPIEDLF